MPSTALTTPYWNAGGPYDAAAMRESRAWQVRFHIATWFDGWNSAVVAQLGEHRALFGTKPRYVDLRDFVLTYFHDEDFTYEDCLMVVFEYCGRIYR